MKMESGMRMRRWMEFEYSTIRFVYYERSFRSKDGDLATYSRLGIY